MLRLSMLPVLVTGVLFCACEPDLGPCDDRLARTVYFDASGTPYYGGQALVSAYCTTGCHSANAVGQARSGVPAELDFDVPVAGNDEMLRAHLRAGQQTIFDWRGEAYDWVESQNMPPEGFPRSGANFTDAAGNTLAGLDEVEGTSILRNWLSCGAPVVERSQEPRAGQMAGDLCTPGDIGDCRVGETDPPEPTWSWLYANYFGTSTCEACHENEAQASAFNTTFVFGSTSQDAYDAIVGVMTDPSGDCMGETIVVSGDADASNLVHKLEGEGAGGAALCGDSMPFGGRPADSEIVQAVRDWINDGATNN